MAINDKFFPGTTVSRHLPAGERSFEGNVYGSGKPVLDAELNLNQEIREVLQQVLRQHQHPSGWLRGQSRYDAYNDYSFDLPSDPGFVPNTFHLRKKVAVVAGFPLVVEYTNTSIAENNLVQLEGPPVFGGAPPDIKRTDFVFLEVWRALVQDSPNASGTVTVLAALPSAGDTILIGGVPLTAVAGAPAVDEFTIGGDEATTAANIAAAINLGTNSFSSTVSATSDGVDTVTIKSVVSGTAGNAITLSVTGVGMTASGATLTGGVDEPNKPTQDTLYRHGNVDADSSVNLPDDLADPAIGIGTAGRVQVQYRIRTTGQSEAINFKTQPDGFSNTSILAQGANSSPVAGYPFVPADRTTISGSSDATAYDIEDNGLWVSGSGDSASASALGTVDGFVYAIPICFVFRRNDAWNSGAGAGWDPQTNTNGALLTTHGGFVNPQVGTIASGESDRPDRAFADAINRDDILDLRRHVAPMGFDLVSELQYQMSSLLDGGIATWAIDAADKQVLGSGSGDVSTRFLVCNQIGRDASHGGTAPTSGSTTRGDTIRNFDHVARRFGDQPVVERLVLEVSPTDDSATYPGKYNLQANGGYSGWAEDDEIHIDLEELNATTIGDWDPSGATYFGFTGNASVDDFAPPGTQITDILSIRHDDGHYTTAVDQGVQVQTITGLGTMHVAIKLDENSQTVNGGNPVNADHPMIGSSSSDNGSTRRIWVELELTYPLGSGLTDTPDEQVVPDTGPWPAGPMLENNTTQRPADMEDIRSPRFREGFREVALEYVANDGSGFGSGTAITDNVVSQDTTTLLFLRRIFGSNALLTGVTDVPAAQPHDIDSSSTEYGSSSRIVKLDTSGGPSKSPLSGAGQTECAITYFAQDPIPNYGGAGGGYQVGVYFRSNAPQTVGAKNAPLLVPDPFTIEPLVMSSDLWSGTVGMGSVDLPFPYTAPLDQIAINDEGSLSFTGEWFFAATASISIDDFSADTGLLRLHGFVPVDGNHEFTFSSADKDLEFRAMYKVSDTSAYRPTMFSQNLSGVVRHKVFTPFLARVTENDELFRKNEIVLVVVSRFAELDSNNTIRFTDTGNRTCAAIYRTRNLLLMVGN